MGLFRFFQKIIGKNNTDESRDAGYLPLKVAVETAGNSIAVIGANGLIEYVNTALLEAHDYTHPVEIIGQPWNILLSPVEQDWFEQEVLSPLDTRGKWSGFSKGFRRDRVEFPQNLSIIKLSDGRWIWVASDVTALDKAVTESNRLLMALEAAADGIGIVDGQGNLAYMNNALMKLHGIEKDELPQYIGYPWVGLYNKAGRDEIDDVVMPILRETGEWFGETRIVKKTGVVTDVAMSLRLLSDGGLVGTARDISEQKRAEKEKEELQRQIFQAQKMEAIGRLSGGIAHDFNNILASILGYTEFLLEDLESDSKQYHFAEQIMTGSLQARQLIDQILSFSRQKETIRQTINVVDIMHDIVGILNATMPAEVELRTNLAEDEISINANETQISQVLMNLCVNARDAIESKKGRVSLSLSYVAANDIAWNGAMMSHLPEEKYAPGIQIKTDPETEKTTLSLGSLAKGVDYASIIIADTGIGINQKIMSQMFDPFFTTKDQDKGTGLGLSTVMGIMSAHQGCLTVESEIGEGTTFTLYFPVSKEQIKKPVEPVEDQPQHDMGKGKGHILIVDDQKLVREAITEMLGRLGYTSTVCASGGVAVDMVRESPGKFDAVVADYQMPKMTGLEMAENLSIDFPDLPIVLMSGYSKGKLDNAQDNYPAVKAILKKPLAKRSLGSTLGQILS